MPEFLPGRSYSYSQLISPTILKENRVDPIDLIEADFAELAVKELRNVLSQAVTRPFGHHRLLWLRNGESASHIHQNTLLKILEEPPATLIVIIEAQNLGRLLPTVRSRLFSVTDNRSVAAVTASFPNNPQQLETYLRAFTDRNSLAKAIEQERSFQAEQFLSSPSAIGSQRLQLLEKTLLRLGVNGNLKIIIDSLLLRWPTT